MKKERLEFIDALRGFAILGVIAAHAGSLVKSPDLNALLSIGGYGVQLFFVISAFTIFLTYERAKQREEMPVRNFFIRRLLRIVPVYWFGIILYTGVYGLESRGWRPGPELWHFPYHLTLTNVLHPLTSSSVVPGGWSISVEVLFYLTVPLWFLLVRNLRSAIAFALGSIFVGKGIVWVLKRVVSFPGVPQAEMWDYWYRLFPSQIGCFAFGIILFYLLKDRRTSWFAAPGKNLLLLGAAIGIFVLGLRWNPVFGLQNYLSCAFMLIAVALSQIPWRAVVNPFTTFVGKISYSGYLLHFLVLKQLTLAIPRGGMSDAVYALVILVLGIAITIPLAWVSFRYIETAFIELGRAWINRLENRPPRSSRGNRCGERTIETRFSKSHILPHLQSEHRDSF